MDLPVSFYKRKSISVTGQAAWVLCHVVQGCCLQSLINEKYGYKQPINQRHHTVHTPSYT